MVMDTDANIRSIFVQKYSTLKGAIFLRSALVFSFDLGDENGTEEFEGKCDHCERTTHNSLQPWSSTECTWKVWFA